MSSDFRKVALVAASLGLILSLVFALRDDDGGQDAATTTTAATIKLQGADQPVRITLRGPGGTLYRGSVKQGREVVIVVRSTVSDRVHLHGYNLIAGVAPGKPGRISFTATIPGNFEVELEEPHLLLAVLEVRP